MKSFAEPRLGILTIVGALSVALGMGIVGSPAYAQEDSAAEADATAQARGEAALAEARRAREAGNWQEAANKYAEALLYLPNHPEALEGQREALIHLQRATTSDAVAQELRLQRQRTIAEYEASERQAEELLRQGDFASAGQTITTARMQLEQRRQYLTDAEYNSLRTRADALQTRIEQARETQRLADEDRIRREAAQQQRLEQERQRQERQRLIDENLLRVLQLQKELKYAEALQIVDEILFIDEHNPSALVLREAIMQNMNLREYSEHVLNKERGIQRMSIDAQRSLIVPRPNITGPGGKSVSGLVEYPEDWPAISIRRDGAGGFIESEADRMVRYRLNEARIAPEFSNNSLEQVVAFLESVTGLPIYVDWRALNNIGIDRDTEVNLRLQEVSAETALERILEQLGDEIDRPQYAIQDGILTISSDSALRRRTVLLVYDIRDLLFQVPTFDNAPSLDLDSALDQGQQSGGFGGGGGGFGGGGGGGGRGGGGGGGGGSGGGIFGDPGDDPDRLTRAELVEQIVNIIQENVDPNGWRDLGGDTGSLQELNGNLIITNTPNNHRAIDGLLSRLREIRALQINVESRFLTVDSNWFEKIGVDLDLYFNTNDDALTAARNVDPNFHLSDFFDPTTGRLKDPVIWGTPAAIEAGTANTFPSGRYIGTPTGTFNGGFEEIQYAWGYAGAPVRATSGFAPIGVTQRSNELVNELANFASTFAAGAAGTPALTVGIQFLDDIQVDLLIEATQADRRSVILTAPRLTFFNGQRAWVAVTTQMAFVSGLTPVTGDASGAFAPQVGVVNDGFVLDVEGVISSDRRYVTMTVLFDFAEILGLETQEFQGAAGGGGVGTGGGNAAVFSGSISLPTVRVSMIRTTVSVPDKGTVLLGGQRSVQEIEVETGVPVLSKIPFVNRFFTNRATEKNEQTLLILIRPEIIIQQENEDILFPGLSDSIGSAGAYLR